MSYETFIVWMDGFLRGIEDRPLTDKHISLLNEKAKTINTPTTLYTTTLANQASLVNYTTLAYAQQNEIVTQQPGTSGGILYSLGLGGLFK